VIVDQPITTYTMSYVDAASVTVSTRESNLALKFNDKVVRSIVGNSLTFDFANGTGDGGLDTGSEASSTWYYLYAVVKPDGSITLKASVTWPGGAGPTGFSTWKYLGAFRNDSSSNIVTFIQNSSKFWYKSRKIAEQDVDNNNSAGQARHNLVLDSFIPLTASEVELTGWSDHSTTDNASIQQYYYVEGETTYHAVVGTSYRSYSRAEGQFSIPTPGVSSKIIQTHQTSTSGDASVSWRYWETDVRGWVDGYMEGAA